MTIPNVAPDGPLETERKSLLSPIGDPVGHILDKGLRPVGYLVGQVAHPAGQAFLDVQDYAKVQLGVKEDSDKGKANKSSVEQQERQTTDAEQQEADAAAQEEQGVEETDSSKT